tara:strand:- start:29238 stop:30449 length:1212 start_codon:yes stop_codon:yes gene_type:complete
MEHPIPKTPYSFMRTPPRKASRILVIVGTRPEAIKMAPIVEELKKSNDVEVRLALTGQHIGLLGQALQTFNLDPDYDLGIMMKDQTLYEVGQGCLEKLKEIVQSYKPDMVLVQGDTATVFFGSMVAFFEKIKVGHVEAGLRSGEKWAPFPEEIFRKLTDVTTDLYFAPTLQAAENLLAENVNPEKIYITGNTIVDALLKISATEQEIENSVLASLLANRDSQLVLLTAHRRESFGDPLKEIFTAVRQIADIHEDVNIVYPVHPNPNVMVPAQEILNDHPRIHLTEPLGYFDLITTVKHASLILTDSGGIQEEAPTFGVPVLVLRQTTERPEAIEAGIAQMVGTDRDRIVNEATKILTEKNNQVETPELKLNPYGDGKAAERIVDILVSDLTGKARLTSDWITP